MVKAIIVYYIITTIMSIIWIIQNVESVKINLINNIIISILLGWLIIPLRLLAVLTNKILN